MARYTGPRRRKLRRLETDLPGLTTGSMADRPYPPGEHGARPGRRRRLSDYALRLREKQKLRWNYGLTETQMRRTVDRAARLPGAAGDNLLSLLERRLDSAVFRLGLAPTIPAARQLVRHRHILVNERRVSVPGFELSPGDRIAVRAQSRDHPHVAEGARSGPRIELPSHLRRDPDGYGGSCVSQPGRADCPVDVDERLVIEFYAR